jgi:hypothetical protein
MNSSNQHNTISVGQISDFNIVKSLKRLPSLSFTQKGMENLCKKYNITNDHLQRLISESLKSQG